MSENNSSMVERENNVIIRREESSGSEQIFSEFNKVWVSGIIEDDFEYSHEYLWEKFYKTRVKVKRLSGNEDFIPIIVPDIYLGNMLESSQKGKYVEVGGQLRSSKKWEDGKSHLDMFLFARSINICESEDELEDVANANLIYLDGFICKSPLYRETPLGKEITDLLVAVNRKYNKSDYIHCIAWGRTAQFTGEMEVGDRIQLYGRVQSREYFKSFSPGSKEGEWKTAYEISIMRLLKVEDLKSEH